MLTRTVSISLRLTLWFGSVFFLGCLLFGTAMWFSLKQTLVGERKQTLERRLDRLQDLLQTSAAANSAGRAQDFRDFAHATGNGLMEVFGPDARRTFPSPSGAAAEFPWPAARTASGERFAEVSQAGQPYLTIARPFSLNGQRMMLLAAAPESGNLLVLNRFRSGIFTSLPLLLIVASAGGYWISRRALQPVDRITATARSIGIRNLSERVPVQQTHDELQRLAETCNQMLERLESAVKRLKQFTADASHELRAPLSLTRTVAEVALRHPALDDTTRAAFHEIVAESANAGVLLDQMLLLARADTEPCGIAMERVDLRAVVRETCAIAARHAEEKGLHLTVACSSDDAAVRVWGNYANLRRLAWILVDNAVKYTSSSGTIGVALSAGTHSATLRVSDTGVGISPQDLPNIFDRFFRADPSRSQVEGNGLGLSIATWIADIHRAQIHVASTPAVGTTFEVVFPLLS